MGNKFPLGLAHIFILSVSLLPPCHYAQAEFAILSRRGSQPKPAAPASKTSSLTCDFFHGSWVYDDSYPLYDSTGCVFIDPEFDCQKYGRSDKLYLKYRWKPSACELPGFDGKDFLTRWTGKTIMFVGDSISYNQWQSLLCMLHASVLRPNVSFAKKDPLSTVRFEINAAYKQALLRFHPDRASRTDIRQQVEAEEKFKLISRLKEKLLL